MHVLPRPDVVADCCWSCFIEGAVLLDPLPVRPRLSKLMSTVAPLHRVAGFYWHNAEHVSILL